MLRQQPSTSAFFKISPGGSRDQWSAWRSPPSWRERFRSLGRRTDRGTGRGAASWPTTSKPTSMRSPAIARWPLLNRPGITVLGGRGRIVAYFVARTPRRRPVHGLGEMSLFACGHTRIPLHTFFRCSSARASVASTAARRPASVWWMACQKGTGASSVSRISCPVDQSL